MKRNFDLTFPTGRGDFRVAISIEKSYTERPSLKTGYNGQPLRWIKVITKDPSIIKISHRKEIAKIVQQDQIQSIWPTEEEDENGNPQYVVVDKTSIQNMYPSNSEMRVLQTLSRDAIPFHCTTQNHYFLNVRKVKKNKTARANPEDVELYSLVHQGLCDNNQVLMVRYYAMNTEKFAIVYADDDGLRLTNLIATNYQKERGDKQKLGSDKGQLFKKLTKQTQADELNESILRDRYGERLEELIRATVHGEILEKKEHEPSPTLRRLADLEDESESESEEDASEEPRKRKHKREHKSKQSKKKYDRKLSPKSSRA